MPNYTFKNKVTGEIREESMKIAEMDEFIKENPDWEVDITGVKIALHSGIGLGLRKPDDGFNDLLKSMKKTHDRRGGKIDIH